MPIKIPNDLPATKVLREEGVMVMREDDAIRQDVRPLRVAILNLMPEKVKTETQLARNLGRTPLQVDITLLTTSSYRPKNVSASHMDDFYREWEDVQREKFDGLVITGAPIERLDFEDVLYWSELRDILDWTEQNVHSCMFLCWSAQAALYHRFGIPKYELPEKLSGVYRHRVLSPASDIVAGFDDEFRVPVSRWTEVRRPDFEAHKGLQIVAESDDAGICLVESADALQFYMFNHFEYDHWTLRDEYQRDTAANRTRACRNTTSRTTIPRRSRATHGARTASSCTATGSTRPDDPVRHRPDRTAVGRRGKAGRPRADGFLRLVPPANPRRSWSPSTTLQAVPTTGNRLTGMRVANAGFLGACVRHLPPGPLHIHVSDPAALEMFRARFPSDRRSGRRRP